MSLIFPAQAVEVPQEESIPTEWTEPAGTVPPTEPVESIPATVPETLPEVVPETTAEPETVPKEETFPPEETVPAETVAETEPTVPSLPPVELLTVAQVLALPGGSGPVQLQGTVVYASGNQAVLQDSTGGIRLSFGCDPGTVPGEILLVTGTRGNGLSVQDFESLGTDTLPSIEYDLIQAPDDLRVHVRGAILGENTISQQDFSLALVSESTLPAGTWVDAWGVILDGIFYADTVLPSQTASAEEPVPETEFGYYFGQLHAHSNPFAEGGTVEEVFAKAALVEGLDFFAVTDHSDSLDNAAFGSIGIGGTLTSRRWAEGKAAAAAVTDGDFVGIYGYELSWPEDYALGHMSTFNTPGWQSYDQSGFQTLEGYFAALKTVPGSVSQFNHPSHAYGNFQLFDGFTPEKDQSVHLMEVLSSGNPLEIDYYSLALDKGWHLAPACNPQKKDGLDACLSPVRTVVLAKELTEESLYEAIRAYRVYATEDQDMKIGYRVNGAVMGSILGPEEALKAEVTMNDLTDSGICTLEVIADGGKPVVTQTVELPTGQLDIALPAGYSYYYLRITQADGDTAITAPVWVDSYADMGIQSFTASEKQPLEGQQVTLALELYNQEQVDFVIETLEISPEGGQPAVVRAPGTVRSLQTLTYRLPYTQEKAGNVTIRAKVTGTAEGHRRSYEQALHLSFQPKQVPMSTISQLRRGTPGMVYRVTGRLTSGNCNLYTTFRDTVYLQDETGGIAITGRLPEGLEIGMAMEFTGILREKNGNLTLEQTAYTFPGGELVRYVPKTVSCDTAMDYSAHGGELLQVEGTVVSLTKTADGKGLSRVTLRDVRGGLATIIIEDNIRSGAYGVNDLASQIRKGRTVRAMGLLHRDEYGDTVLRARNCEEVVYIPPTADPTNPKTGDWLNFLLSLFQK